MKIHLPGKPVSDTSKHETIAPGSVLGDWQLDRQVLMEGCEQRLLQYRAAPEGTPTNFDYLLHTPIDPESESAFSLLRREYHISQQFSSPHLLPVLDVHLKTTPFFIVTPHLPGCTLRNVLQTRGTLESRRPPRSVNGSNAQSIVEGAKGAIGNLEPAPGKRAGVVFVRKSCKKRSKKESK